jgi:hypothetical protein
MLKFMDNNDFLLVDKYKQNDDGSVNWTYSDGATTHSGAIYEGLTRDEGEETIDIWAKLQSKISSNTITVEGETQDELDTKQIAAFKSSRNQLVSQSVVTTSTGKRFQGDKESVAIMLSTIIEHMNEPDDTIIEWSTEDVGTGIMVECTKAEIVEAHSLAVAYVRSVWGI